VARVDLDVKEQRVDVYAEHGKRKTWPCPECEAACGLAGEENRMLLIILLVVLALSIGGGTWGHSRYGYAGWSPAALILVVLVLLYLTGHL
jgi:hypothetical protein